MMSANVPALYRRVESKPKLDSGKPLTTQPEMENILEPAHFHSPRNDNLPKTHYSDIERENRIEEDYGLALGIGRNVAPIVERLVLPHSSDSESEFPKRTSSNPGLISLYVDVTVSNTLSTLKRHKRLIISRSRFQ